MEEIVELQEKINVLDKKMNDINIKNEDIEIERLITNKLGIEEENIEEMITDKIQDNHLDQTTQKIIENNPNLNEIV